MPRVTDVRILPREISDHAPLLLVLYLSLGLMPNLWMLSRYWISDVEVEGQFGVELTGYWATNAGSAAAEMMWEAFKVAMRGHYQAIIARVRRKLGADLTRAERDASLREATYVRTRDPRHYAQLQAP